MPLLPPPVPKRLCELLQNYPEHIERLRAAIEKAASAGGANAPRTEYIVWALEDVLESFISEEKNELDAARSAGSADDVAKAEVKEMLMNRAALKQQWIGDSGLIEFFKKDKGQAE
ncbi:hypothetical protein ABE473_16685 [Stenotrophomonas sp. TWI700]|uniref:hypothetical protein n=1 Tax=Stenotrophomonas sp. TWI700 TaxID=3136792 RepID=UPI003209A07F